LVRVVTTGGGGWGDPLEREVERVRQDVIDGKVSLDAAQQDYGVVFANAMPVDEDPVDLAATDALRATLREQRTPRELIDRGPGYQSMTTRKA